MSGQPPPPQPPPPSAPPTAPRARPSRRQVAAALGAIVVLIVGGVVTIALVNRHAPNPARASQARQATTNGGITTEDQLITAAQMHGLTPTRAEQLFALDIGVLPGVSVNDIKADRWFDGTDALLGLQQVWVSLPKPVQVAATRLTTSANTVRGPGLGPATASARYVLTAYTDAEYLALAQTANAEESAKLGVAPISGFVIDISNAIAADYAVTTSYELQIVPTVKWIPWPDGCHIEVNALKMQGLAAEDVAAIMSHEVFHCFQQRTAGSNQAAGSVHRWVSEGEATWVMEQLHPTNTVDDAAWFKYTFTPTTVYSDRAYDAVGVYGHQGDLAGDQGTIWPVLLPMEVAAVGGLDKPAFALLVGSDSNRFYSTWGGSYYEDQTQSDWHMGGPGIPPTTGPSPRSVTIANDDAQEIGLFGAYQAAQTTIDATADILVVNLTSGYGKAHDNGYAMDRTLDTSAPLALCMNPGGCKCPDGSPGASEHTIPATSPVSVGLDGGDQALAAYASGVPLTKFCKQPDQPPPSPGPAPPGGGGGGGGGGGSSEPEPPTQPPAQSAGDPHLLAFDHRRYDLQAVGEFTLVKSTVDDFIVQTRTAPLPGSTTIAVNVAVAAKVSGHRLTLSLQNETIITRVDGVVDGHEYFSVGGVTVQRLGTEVGAGYVVEWPDSTRLRVDQMGVVGLNESIWPAASRAGQLVGLLGNDNGQSSADFVTANGVNLGVTPSPATIHSQFADSWRLTQAASLFDYGPGETTATFTDRTFPHAFVNASTIPNAARAMQACQGDGITDTGILADCIVDDAATNNQSVLSHYAQAQLVFTVASNIAGNLPPFAGMGGSPSPSPSQTTTPAANGQGLLIDSGGVTNANDAPVFTFTANADDIIWFAPSDCQNGELLVFAVVDPQGRALYSGNAAEGLICQDTRYALTTAGTYQLIANADKSRTGQYSLPIHFERHDQVFQTSYGQTNSGDIPDPATHDIYVFTAQLGDVVHVFGAGCNVASIGSVAQSSPIYLTLADSAGKTISGLDCAQDSNFTIQGSATYEIIANEPEHGPGSYQFTIQK